MRHHHHRCHPAAYVDSDQARATPFDAIEIDLPKLWHDAAIIKTVTEEIRQ